MNNPININALERRCDTKAMAKAMYQKQCEYVGANHEEKCIELLRISYDSFEDRCQMLQAELARLRAALARLVFVVETCEEYSYHKALEDSHKALENLK